MNKELKYGTPAHDRIRDALKNRIKQAEFAVSEKSTDYSNDEDRFQSFMPETSVDAARRVKKKAGEPQFTTLVVPYDYAVLMSWHTYITTVFLSRSPVMQFMGRHGETEQQIQSVEAIMDYQTQVGGHVLPYYIWVMDAGKYGVGVLGNYWDEEVIQTSQIVEEQVSYFGIPIAGKTKKRKVTNRTKGYQGNKLFNIRPQDFMFDSRVSLGNFQKGEYAGHKATMSWNILVKRAEEGQYYNMEALRAQKGVGNSQQNSSDGYRDTGSARLQLPHADQSGGNVVSFTDQMSPDFATMTVLVVELIPKDWKLGNSTYPEKWVFTLAENQVIIESQPAEDIHGRFPYGVIEYEMEGYGLQKESLLSRIAPLNETMTWLMNTHFYNVRHTLNGQFVADPSRITMKDFKSEGAGGRILRVKPAAYGQDVRSMVSQLPIADVTQGHLRDMAAVGDLIQRISGVTDNIMGAVNPGGRKTATEIRNSNSFGATRLKTQAEWFSAQGWAPLSQQMLQNTQQYYDAEMKFKLAGDLMEEGQKFLDVNPEAIAGFYDFVPVDGTMPVDRFAQVTMWTQLLGQMRQFPEVLQKYDMGGIFGWVAQLGGLKNIKRFRIQTASPEAIEQGRQSGNLVGIDDARRATQGTGGTPQNSTGVPGASQVPGLGPTG